jgi:hypothetical protein
LRGVFQLLQACVNIRGRKLLGASDVASGDNLPGVDVDGVQVDVSASVRDKVEVEALASEHVAVAQEDVCISVVFETRDVGVSKPCHVIGQ